MAPLSVHAPAWLRLLRSPHCINSGTFSTNNSASSNIISSSLTLVDDLFCPVCDSPSIILDGFADNNDFENEKNTINIFTNTMNNDEELWTCSNATNAERESLERCGQRWSLEYIVQNMLEDGKEYKNAKKYGINVRKLMEQQQKQKQQPHHEFDVDHDHDHDFSLQTQQKPSITPQAPRGRKQGPIRRQDYTPIRKIENTLQTQINGLVNTPGTPGTLGTMGTPITTSIPMQTPQKTPTSTPTPLALINSNIPLRVSQALRTAKSLDEMEAERVKKMNEHAMRTAGKNDVCVENESFMEGVLSVDPLTMPKLMFQRPKRIEEGMTESGAKATDRKGNKLPIGKYLGYTKFTNEWRQQQTMVGETKEQFNAEEVMKEDGKAVVLYQPSSEECKRERNATPMVVEPFLTEQMRPHQQDGVKFMAECTLGLRKFEGNGCILADDMGLGKTMQTIVLMYTLLTQGMVKNTTICKKAIVVCPVSIVTNWKNEIAKWTGDRLAVIAVTEHGVEQMLPMWTHPAMNTRVLIISYEMFQRYAESFMDPQYCDLLICDEAHRLKNMKIKTYEALNALPCKRRILLSGTPLQNDLGEFYAMVNFINPNVLGSEAEFDRTWGRPIALGRDPDASDEESAKSQYLSIALSTIVNQFILRRTNAILSKHLPPKVISTICCRPTRLQMDLIALYASMKGIKKDEFMEVDGSKKLGVLPIINALKKICNHPQLVMIKPDNSKKSLDKKAETDKDEMKLQKAVKEKLSQKHANFMNNMSLPQWSGKMYVLDCLLQQVRATTHDKFVIVSNYTQTLDLIEKMCQMRRWICKRLDGSTDVKKRQKLVDTLTDNSQNVFVFLLSSKAGGCGLNMIGANRLVLFDPDWNPAVDKQAAARIWRDGQKKQCYIYRFLTAGTIEEKIYQRQLTKEGLAAVIGGGATAEDLTSWEDLRDLFTVRDTLSSTHDEVDCDCLVPYGYSNKRREKEEARHKHSASEKDFDGEEEEMVTADIEIDHKLLIDEAKVSTGCKRKKSVAVKTEKKNKKDDNHLNSANSKTDEENYETEKTMPETQSNTQTLNIKDSDVKAALGQRGHPQEDELINWAHHASVQSLPDNAFRQIASKLLLPNQDIREQYKQMPNGQLRLLRSWVTFAFSLEVTGKPLHGIEAAQATKHSAQCDAPPAVIKKIERKEMTIEEANRIKSENTPNIFKQHKSKTGEGISLKATDKRNKSAINESAAFVRRSQRETRLSLKAEESLKSGNNKDYNLENIEEPLPSSGLQLQQRMKQILSNPSMCELVAEENGLVWQDMGEEAKLEAVQLWCQCESPNKLSTRKTSSCSTKRANRCSTIASYSEEDEEIQDTTGKDDEDEVGKNETASECSQESHNSLNDGYHTDFGDEEY